MNQQEFIKLLQDRRKLLEREKQDWKSDSYKKLYTIKISEIDFLLKEIEERRIKTLDVAAQGIGIEDEA